MKTCKEEEEEQKKKTREKGSTGFIDGTIAHRDAKHYLSISPRMKTARSSTKRVVALPTTDIEPHRSARTAVDWGRRTAFRRCSSSGGAYLCCWHSNSNALPVVLLLLRLRR